MKEIFLRPAVSSTQNMMYFIMRFINLFNLCVVIWFLFLNNIKLKTD